MSANDNLPPLPPYDHLAGGWSTVKPYAVYTADQMREYGTLARLSEWQRGWNEFSDLREQHAAASPWLPIDGAPKGQSLLLWTDHGPALGWWSVFDNQWTAGLWTALFPTHYMLIPPMPESKP